MDSVKIVDEKNSVHRTSAGVKGQIGVIDVAESVSRMGDSGASIGNSVMMICKAKRVKTSGSEGRKITHPKALLAKEVRMT